MAYAGTSSLQDVKRLMEAITVPKELKGKRLDQALAFLLPAYSRSRLKQWIEAGQVSVDGKTPRPRDRVAGGERIELRPMLEPQASCPPRDIPLEVVFEDEHLIVIDKPAGLVVHPAAGHFDDTLLNALLHHAPELSTLPRAGIVHRLDKDTSGVLVVAKTLKAHKSLVDQLKARTVKREYLALVQGQMTSGGSINAPIGRHPTDRKRFAVVQGGKEAITHYRIAERFPHHTLLRVFLETGRTHQIRVHFAHLRFPLVGDAQYSRLRLPPGASPELSEALRSFKRQALHAEALSLYHPESGEAMTWRVPIAQDLENLLARLRAEAQNG